MPHAPIGAATSRPATVKVRVGETFDFAWWPSPGSYRLMAGPPEKRVVVQEWIVQ